MEDRFGKKRSVPPATTKDLVGRESDVQVIPERWRRIYRKLSNLRDQFLSRRNDLKASAQEEKPVFSLHMGDAATDSYDRDWALSMLSTEQNALYEIDQAMRRIQDGSYGICEITGKPIPAERLEAIPWTRFSVEVEENLERRGEADRTQLGELRPVARVSGDQAEKES